LKRTAHNGYIVGSSPTKPTTPSLPYLDLIQGSRSPRHPADLNLATWNHTAAAALWARLLGLPLTSALAACPLPSPSFGEYGFHNTGSSDIYSIAMLYSFDSEGVVETLRESRCEGSDRRSSRDGR